MENVSNQLKNVLDKNYPLLKSLNEINTSQKPSVEKWSKKEELGHLIDSAQNNVQRFIRVQYEADIQVLYHPDNWVKFNNYQNNHWTDLIELWHLLNRQIIVILQHMPKEKEQFLISADKDASAKNTILFIAEDYVLHMIHHLNNILSD